jgi:DNA-binding Lrp family transcriptional regulator
LRLKEDIEKLRQLLKDGPLSWGELKEKTQWSLSVLKDRIDIMENRGEISTTTGKRNGRRKTLYGLANLERSKAESGKYKAVQFIQSLSNPVYDVEETDDKKKSVSAFISSVPDDLREKAQENVEKIAKHAAKTLFFSGKGLKQGQKIAVIFTVKG